jgi:hypothetical protein
MATMYNQVGALEELLRRINVAGINSLNDIYEFWKDFDKNKNEVLSQTKESISNEIKDLEEKEEALMMRYIERRQEAENRLEHNIQDLDTKISLLSKARLPKVFNWVFSAMGVWLRYRKNRLVKNFKALVEKDCRPVSLEIRDTKNLIQYLKDNFEVEVESRSQDDITRLKKTQAAILENKPLYYGAIGEEKTRIQLDKLPDSYCVINNYIKYFNPPIIDRKNNDPIQSIQVDHLVVGPTGLFVIESKNWSQQTISENRFFSPVRQVKRNGFALFARLNRLARHGYLPSFIGQEGVQQISPRKIIVSSKRFPEENVQFVKFMPPERLPDYITYGERVFSDQQIAELENLLSQN